MRALSFGRCVRAGCCTRNARSRTSGAPAPALSCSDSRASRFRWREVHPMTATCRTLVLGGAAAGALLTARVLVSYRARPPAPVPSPSSERTEAPQRRRTSAPAPGEAARAALADAEARARSREERRPSSRRYRKPQEVPVGPSRTCPPERTMTGWITVSNDTVSAPARRVRWCLGGVRVGVSSTRSAAPSTTQSGPSRLRRIRRQASPLLRGAPRSSQSRCIGASPPSRGCVKWSCSSSSAILSRWS